MRTPTAWRIVETGRCHYGANVIGVSIVLFRSPLDQVAATLRALAAQTQPPAVVIVHANETADGQAEQMRARLGPPLGALPLQLTTSEANLGFSGAHNRCLESLFTAGCDAVLVLNPDLVLDPRALAELSRAAEELEPAVLLGPVLELADPVTQEPTGRIDTVGIRWTIGARHLDDRQGEPMVDLPTTVRRVAGISGACLYVTRAAHDLLVSASGEFFDEDFVAYREDAELAHRAALLGIPSMLVPAARGAHIRRLRGTLRGADPAIDALGVRNRFLIAFKYGAGRPGWLVAALARDALVVAGVVIREPTSLPALTAAWRLRRRMRDKGRQVRAFAATHK
jgi:GT2 family glycosyltransferase